jgi:hypothetical protein
MKHRDVLLVGSIPLENASEVFNVVGKKLSGLISRIPDGETGNRLSWLGWQDHVFENHPNFETEAHEGDPRAASTPDWMKLTRSFKIKDGVHPDSIEIGPLQYAENAIESYSDFVARRNSGFIDNDVKFQISIPSPFNVINSAIKPDHKILVEPSYEVRLEREIDEIIEKIPASDLAIQWDCAHDMQAFDNARPVYFDDRQNGIVERLVRIGDWVPDNVELGYHFCYGSLGGKHFVEPKDMGAMVDLANRLTTGLGRVPEWIHMPVPIERDDDEYYSSLSELRLNPSTKLYLGLIHGKDGLIGTKRRIVAAEKFIKNFGIATECGFGRRPANTVPDLIDLHAEVANTE